MLCFLRRGGGVADGKGSRGGGGGEQGVSVNPSAPQAKLKLWRRAHLREQSIYVKGAKKSGGNFIYFFVF